MPVDVHENGGISCTGPDGIAAFRLCLAEQAGAYWLMDAIASHQSKALRNDRLRDFQLWRLDVKKNKAALLCFADSNEEHLIRQKISYTDFPLDSIELYCVPVDEKRRVIVLKNEY